MNRRPGPAAHDAVEDALPDHIPDHGDLHRLAARILHHATDRDRTLATAESCTGGLVASVLTDIPGSSHAYLGGWVVYANQRKTDDLGVPASVIDAHGAVSGPVAEALARGARERSGADVAVATTGIAGPGGGTQEKPVGTVWIGVAGPDGAHADLHETDHGDRLANKAAFARGALEALAAALGVEGRSDTR